MGSRAGAGLTRGFTLLELIVCLAVLGVAVAVVTPSVSRGTDGLRTRAEVASFAATLRHAREQAINTQRTRRVVIDRDAHRLSIMAPEGPTAEREVRETRAFSSRLVVEPLQAPEVIFDSRGGASGGEFRLTSGNIAYRVTVDRLTGRVRSIRE